ncbi:MAG: hypothetical protein QGI33_05575, partial [Candidatus Brocadiia bacterium]|nr:hypothetical protein [Candidatus Brocadiia bacterium]
MSPCASPCGPGATPSKPNVASTSMGLMMAPARPACRDSSRKAWAESRCAEERHRPLMQGHLGGMGQQRREHEGRG